VFSLNLSSVKFIFACYESGTENMKDRKGKPRSTYHHGNLRQELLDASIAIIAEQGIEAMSLRDVARRAGVSPAAPYHHFESKDALLNAIAHDGFAELSRVMLEAREAAAPEPTARLRAIGAAYVRFARERPAYFHVMFRRSPWPKSHDFDDPADSFNILINAVREVRDIDAVGRRISQRGLIMAAWSLVHGAANLLVDGPLANGLPGLDITPDAVPDLVVTTLETLLRALVPKPENQRR